MAKAPWKRDISSQENVELELDLPTLFEGYLVPDSASLRQAVGQEVIDIIRERTTEGQHSWKGPSFKFYSPDYVDSVEFKAYGKEKSEPNLTQSGDMLGLMTVKETRDPGKIKVGWNDSLQSEKAHGHITGAVGVKRDFFGLSDGEIEAIREKFTPDLETASEESQSPGGGFADFLTGRRSIAEVSLNEVLASFFGRRDDG